MLGKIELVSYFYRFNFYGIFNIFRVGILSSRGVYIFFRLIYLFIFRCIIVREVVRLYLYFDWFRFYVIKWYGFR